MDYHHHESKYKPQPRRRSGRDNPPRGGPMRGSVTKGRVADVRRAIYSGQDRLGSYARGPGESWLAFDRLGRPLGTFSSERAAIAAIDPSEAP
jgi:hypothetical protein